MRVVAERFCVAAGVAGQKTKGGSMVKGATASALAACTPNIAWARWWCEKIVRMNGEGTSSATPQIAAAAALYLQRHAERLFDVDRYPEPWMRVEAVRQALFLASEQPSDEAREQLGNGVLRAVAAAFLSCRLLRSIRFPVSM